MARTWPRQSVGYSSLPYDPFTTFYNTNPANIRVVASTALPGGTGASIKDTEKTYALMMHMSKSLGANCTFCHNSRQFSDWAESRPQRVTAWHGIDMVRTINGTYIDSLANVFPANRKGPHGRCAQVQLRHLPQRNQQAALWRQLGEGLSRAERAKSIGRTGNADAAIDRWVFIGEWCTA